MGEHLGEGQSEVEGLLLAILYRASNAVEACSAASRATGASRRGATEEPQTFSRRSASSPPLLRHEPNPP